MNTSFTKAELRKKLLAKRKKLNPDEVSKGSDILVSKLSGLVKSDYKVHCFLPLANDNEPDLREFIEICLEENAVVYTTDPTTRSIIYPTNEIARNSIKQFKIGQDIQFDLIIVPMLGFSGLHRLGFGGGFYDRFLVTQPKAVKIGVCFKGFEINNLPTELHDVALDKILVV